MNPETLAVNHINRILEDCFHLDPDIQTNDRTPFTDGVIDYYKSKSPVKAKKDFDGRAHVQVKGRTRKNPSNISGFSCKKEDIEGWMKIPGILFFFVAISKDKAEKVAYYANLSPFALAHYLKSMRSTQKSLTIPLQRLPKSPEEVEGIVKLSILQSREDPKIGFDAIPIENIQGVSLHVVKDLDFTAPIILNRNDTDFLLEVQTNDGSSIPLDANIQIVPDEYQSRWRERPIQAGDLSVERFRIQRVDTLTIKIQITLGITLTIKDLENSKLFTVNYSPRRDVSGRLFDLEFISELLLRQELSIDGDSYKIPFNKPANFGDLQTEHRNLSQVNELLKRLKIDSSLIDVDTITPRQWKQLGALHANIVLDKEVVEHTQEQGRILQPLADWFIELMILPASRAGHWNYYSLTDISAGSFAVSERPDKASPLIAVTCYELIDPDRLDRTLNLNNESICDHYDKIKDSPHADYFANKFLLSLISSADSQPSRKLEFLDLASRLNEWLLNRQGDREINRVNAWQIIARARNLNFSELSEIRRLRRSTANDDLGIQLALACSILLNDKAEVDDLQSQLPIEQLTLFQTYPIWNLWENLT